jgi:hypothetical protein
MIASKKQLPHPFGPEQSAELVHQATPPDASAGSTPRVYIDEKGRLIHYCHCGR